MTLDPHNLLSKVHPDLVKVIENASQEPQPFQVVYGIRTLAEEAEAVATGHSQTMHSRHLPDPHYDNLAMAVDIACLTDGKIDWSVMLYTQAAQQIEASARSLGIDVQWGGSPVGAWVDGVTSHFRDWGHYQLDPVKYP